MRRMFPKMPMHNSAAAAQTNRRGYSLVYSFYKAGKNHGKHQCKHHCPDQNFCSLDRIKVVTHEENPTVTQCTDCHSFEVKSSCCAQ